MDHSDFGLFMVLKLRKFGSKINIIPTDNTIKVLSYLRMSYHNFGGFL